VALFGSSNPQKVAYTDSGCTVEPLVLQEPFDSFDAVAFVGKRLLVGGSNKVEGRPGPHLVREYDLKGQPRGAAFGNPDSGDDHFCYVHGFTECAPGTCVVYGNCRSLRIWGTKGNFVGAANMMKLLGLSYPWISGFTPAIKGSAYVTATQERGKRTGVYQGLVYRVNGL